ncbi:hypothetical protein STEG23_024066, partial [Scotinomys teguina]
MARAGMERWRDRLALVTGASGGIGAAVARALVQQGLKVVGCARTVGNIEELAAECKSAGYPGTLIPYRCDLSIEEDILSMFSAVRSQHGGVDICINNAGMARPDTLLSGSTSGWKDMFNVNVLALSICTREAYQSMKERNVDDGHIININSMCGHRVPPESMIHFYSATKYAVTALTEGLRQELLEAQTHIRATCISPGLVETQFAFKLHDKNPERAAATYEDIKCLKPEDVAEAVIYVLSTPPHVQAKVQQGWLVVGTVGCPGPEISQSSKVPVTSCLEFVWDQPTLLVLGNEGSGLSQEVLACCQLLLTILPRRHLPPGLESLNVSVATGPAEAFANYTEEKGQFRLGAGLQALLHLFLTVLTVLELNSRDQPTLEFEEILLPLLSIAGRQARGFLAFSTLSVVLSHWPPSSVFEDPFLALKHISCHCLLNLSLYLSPGSWSGTVDMDTKPNPKRQTPLMTWFQTSREVSGESEFQKFPMGLSHGIS